MCSFHKQIYSLWSSKLKGNGLFVVVLTGGLAEGLEKEGY